jgi:hypothetical protein
MAYTRMAYPAIQQKLSEKNSYQLGSFDADDGQWFRVTVIFDVMPLQAEGPNVSTGSYYSVTVQAPDGTSTLVDSGEVVGGPLWFRGGVIGGFQAQSAGTYNLFFDTWPDRGMNPSGCCHYINMAAVVDTPMTLTPGTPPVAVLTVPDFTSYGGGTSTFPIGSFPAVAGQAYMLSCAFDASTNGGTLGYNLAGDFTGFPDGFNYSDSSLAKCFLTGVVTARETGPCAVQLFAGTTYGQATIANFSLVATPFMNAIAA